MSPRNDGRQLHQLRPVNIFPDYNKHAEGSTLISCGDTRVICTASVEERIPPFLRGMGQGWITSEYGMIPRSTRERMIRESSRGRISGRTQEIQRLIGRSLRSVVDMQALGERTVWLDCDVIQADGGTRTLAITGSFVALTLALSKLRENKIIKTPVLLDYLAAVSVGIVDGEPRLDLNYEEDAAAQVDMNVVMTGLEAYVEVQGTAEGKPFSQEALDLLLKLARDGICQLLQIQRTVLEEHLGEIVDLFQTAPMERIATSSGNDQ